ncbi:MAG: asparagine synthase (glutamine-hydrolyzing) [Nanoarchaeota archaeon]|nr:asparagine synthase (glutamine-hydrolyzing) [Nanoarchaeota archaeon]
MCGITGIYDTRGGTPVLESDLIRMRDTLSYRGPDSAGIYISPDGRVGLGHRRLAIIDLTEAGAQPMTYRGLRIKALGSESHRARRDQELIITFNGEIYNFKELREELRKKGCVFRSESDTEVILAAYAEYGAECVKKFNGMFAFAIWDEKNKILFAARDHVGIKPFYYSFENGVFLFGSEIKAILAHPSFKKELNEESVPLYLTFGCVPAPHTLFRGVKKLPAAHYLTIDGDGWMNIQEYWNPVQVESCKLPLGPELGVEGKVVSLEEQEKYFVSETRRILEDSIRMQMVSDVPFGCFLSGGIDSSTNASLMSRALGSPVETFSIGVKDFGVKYNEFEYSRKTAELLGAKRHETLAGREDLLSFLPEFALHADDPQADFISFLVYYLSKLTRDSGVIVAQVGEGADEIFAGYDQYPKFLSSYRAYRRFSPLSRLATPFFSSNPYVERLMRGQEPYWGLAVAFSKNGASYEVIKNLYNEVDRALPEADMLTRMTYIDLKIRLPEFLLARVDKMAMAHSIETRVPFLDHRLVELAFQIPEALKLKNKTTKYILKQAVRGIIPDEIIDRKKQGFGAPVKEWLRGPATAKEFTDIIFNSKIRERGFFDYASVQKLISEHQAGKADHTFRIWTLVTLSLWYDRWIG